MAVLALGVAPAQAHAALISTTPVQGSELAAAPTAVTLTFSEDVGLNGRSLQVVDRRGRRVDDGRARHIGDDPRTLEVRLPGGLAKGSYTVTWRVVSQDGHPASGTFSFGVGVPAGTVEVQVAGDAAVGLSRRIAQLLSYAGAALLIGASVFLFVLWPAGHRDGRMRRLTVTAVAVAGVGAVGALLLQGPYVAGRRLDGVLDVGLLGETANSGYGRPLLLRVLAVALSLPVLGLWPRLPEDEDPGPGGIAAAGNAVLLAASFSLTGHAAEGSPRLLAELVDGVHLTAAGVWLGGLAVLLLAYLPQAARGRPLPVMTPAGSGGPVPGEGVRQPRPDGGPAAVLSRWSPVAATAVGLLVATGAYQAWRETRSLDALTGTAYGRLLVAKIAIVAVLLGVAGAARLLVARLAADRSGAGTGTGRLRGTVAAEAALGLAVLAVTSWLVSTPPARSTYGPPFSASLQGRDVEGTPIQVVVDVTPTRVGPQTIRLRTYTPTGQALPFASASGELRPTGDAGPVRLTFTPVADGEAVATGVVVPSRGRWTLTVQVLTDASTDYAATTAYRVH